MQGWHATAYFTIDSLLAQCLYQSKHAICRHQSSLLCGVLVGRANAAQMILLEDDRSCSCTGTSQGTVDHAMQAMMMGARNADPTVIDADADKKLYGTEGDAISDCLCHGQPAVLHAGLLHTTRNVCKEKQMVHDILNQ